MTVYDNMAFGLKLRHVPKKEIDARVKEAARILGIEMYLSRKPKALSGGQRQRVALGRAIVREPKVFLLDEPLSNLDAKLRAQMRTELTKLHNRLATTFIYVTHDQIEAMTMGTRIVVMKDGFVQQVDTPMNLYDHPVNLFVAGFIGTPQMNFIEGTVVGSKGKVYVQLGDEKLLIPKERVECFCNLDKYLNTGKPVVFGIRPEDVHNENDWIGTGKGAEIDIKIDVIEALGAETLLYCKTKSEYSKINGEVSVADDVSNLIAKVNSHKTAKVGDIIPAAVDMTQCHVFDKETEVTLIAVNKEDKERIESLQEKAVNNIELRRALQAEKERIEKEKLAEKEAKKHRFKKSTVVEEVADVAEAVAIEDAVSAEAPVAPVEDVEAVNVAAPVDIVEQAEKIDAPAKKKSTKKSAKSKDEE